MAPFNTHSPQRRGTDSQRDTLQISQLSKRAYIFPILRRVCFATSALTLAAALTPLACAPGGYDAFWDRANQPYDDEIVGLEVTGQAQSVANGYIMSTRPTATGLLLSQLDDVLSDSNVGGIDDDVEFGIDGGDLGLDLDEEADSCPLQTEWSLGQSVSCRGLSTLATGFAFNAATPLQQRLQQDVAQRHGQTLNADEITYVSSWNNEAIYSGIRSGSVMATEVLREMDFCDQRLAAEERAFRFGEEQGKALVAEAEGNVIPSTPKTQCNTDSMSVAVRAEAMDKARNANKACAGVQLDSIFDTIAVERYESKRKEGLQSGIDDAYELLRVRLVSSWECEAPEPPPAPVVPDQPEPDTTPSDDCQCWARHSGAGPVYCFPKDSFGSGGPYHGGDLEQKSYNTRQCVPEYPSTPKPIGSPLVFDLDSDGIKLSYKKVSFDLAHTGDLVEIPAIVGADALLALDLDGNGKIDSGAELFGNSTSCGDFGRCVDGIQALAFHESNVDRVIDRKDPIFSELLLWKDANQDGASQANELSALDDHDIVRVGLDATLDQAWVDDRGNSASRAITFTRSNGEEDFVHDVWFALTFDKMPKDLRAAGIVTTDF